MSSVMYSQRRCNLWQSPHTGFCSSHLFFLNLQVRHPCLDRRCTCFSFLSLFIVLDLLPFTFRFIFIVSSPAGYFSTCMVQIYCMQLNYTSSLSIVDQCLLFCSIVCQLSQISALFPLSSTSNISLSSISCISAIQCLLIAQ